MVLYSDNMQYFFDGKYFRDIKNSYLDVKLNTTNVIFAPGSEFYYYYDEKNYQTIVKETSIYAETSIYHGKVYFLGDKKAVLMSIDGELVTISKKNHIAWVYKSKLNIMTPNTCEKINIDPIALAFNISGDCLAVLTETDITVYETNNYTPIFKRELKNHTNLTFVNNSTLTTNNKNYINELVVVDLAKKSLTLHKIDNEESHVTLDLDLNYYRMPNRIKKKLNNWAFISPLYAAIYKKDRSSVSNLTIDSISIISKYV